MTIKIDMSQLLKGTLEGCILKVIEDEESYGYMIVERLKIIGFDTVSESTCYPILLRMEKKEWLKSSMKSSPIGPDRKYYAISEQGKIACREFNQQWQHMNTIVSKLMEDLS